MRSSWLPDLWIAIVDTRFRLNEVRRVLKLLTWGFSRWMLNSPSSTRGVPSLERFDSNTYHFSNNLPSWPGGQWTTTKWISTGWVLVIAWDSNELLPVRDGRRSNFHSFEIRRPVPPPLPIVRGVWEIWKLGLPPTYSVCFLSVSSNSGDLKAHSEYKWLNKKMRTSYTKTFTKGEKSNT